MAAEKACAQLHACRRAEPKEEVCRVEGTTGVAQGIYVERVDGTPSFLGS